MEHPFMRSVYAKSFDTDAYVAYLSGQYAIFSELERLCASHRAQEPLNAVYDEALHRSAALLADIRFWGGEGLRPSSAVPSKSTAKYLQRLQADSLDPWLLFCHHFLNYNAVLSGGQFLGGMVSARAGAEPPIGAEFYAFPTECLPAHGRVQQYIDQVDALPISEQLRGRMLECMQAVYALLLEMFDEVYAMAPVAGISYGQSKAASATDGNAASGADGNGSGEDSSQCGRGSKVPPPPFEAADRQMTMSELKRHNAMDAATLGIPLLTSVLGRVYDVSCARDLFGVRGPYEMFAGHDGTYNLAVMSLKTKTLDKFTYHLDDEERCCLADWIAYFDNRYGRPVAQLSGEDHSVKLSELPRAVKIPFASEDEDEDDTAASASSGPAQASRL